MATYSVDEKIRWVKYSYIGHTYREVSTIFHEAFPNRAQLHFTTIRRIVNQFERIGNVTPPQPHRYRVREDSVRDQVEALVAANPNASTRKIAAQVGKSQSTVFKKLKKSGFRSNKIQVHQELLPQDRERRM